MRSQLFILSTLIALAMSGAANAADFGLGIIIGSPTGISAKYGLSQNHAIDGALAWDLSENHIHLSSDYLWIKRGGLNLEQVALDWYFGVGGRVVVYNRPKNSRDDDYAIGVRGPIGVGYTFKDPRIEIFGELALIMNLIESTSVNIEGGIGARFHF